MTDKNQRFLWEINLILPEGILRAGFFTCTEEEVTRYLAELNKEPGRGRYTATKV